MAEAAPRRIVFAHANGFPAGSYRQLFETWRGAGYEVDAIEKVGHDPRFPVTSNWPDLRAQLIDFIERRVGGPAYLVGHSLGGYLSVMTASRRPDLALGVVMLDSPIVAGWKAQALRFAKATGFGERWSPARISRRRRQQWESAEAAQAHFAGKAAFGRWADGVLADYIASGTEPDEQGRRLAFDREVETAIYNTLPDRLDRNLRVHPLRCPLGFVRGTASNEVRQVGMRATERLARGRIRTIEGSHLFPFEKPGETARLVLELIGGMQPPADEPS